MSPWLKLLIGLLVTLFIAWLSHGPLGRGAAYAGLLQQRADFVLRISEVPNVQARISQSPLSRTVFLCGPTNDFQRHGINDLPGLDGRMLQVGGISGVVWDPPAPTPNGATPPCRPDGPGAGTGGGIPLLVELFALVLVAWLIGLALGWQFRRRAARKDYLS